MIDNLTRAVKALNNANRAINQSFTTFASYASNPKHFPKVAAVMMFASGIVGFGLMELINIKREKNLRLYMIEETNYLTNSDDNNIKVMSQDETLVRAMVENAKSSTPRENLENAAMAQKNFMLIPFDQSVVGNEKNDRYFLQQIARKSEEIRKNNNNHGDESKSFENE